MGASPDGLVIDPSEQQPLGLVEIKCPARAEKLSLFDLSTNKEHKSTFCLRYIRDTYELKRRHNYYYQVQGQLHITRRSWCDFVLWTPSATVDSLFVERIYYDDTFWSNTMYPRLYRFYMGSMLPELAHPRRVSNQEVREVILFWNHDDLCPAPQSIQ